MQSLPLGLGAIALFAISNALLAVANGPDGDRNGDSNLRVLDISVHRSTDAVNFSTGQMGKYAKINNFYAKNRQGFNAVNDGRALIWKSDTEIVKDAHQYTELEVDILSFTTEEPSGKNRAQVYSQRIDRELWLKIDAIQFMALMTRHHPRISLDIRSTISTSSVEITDKSTSKNIDKTFVIKLPALVMTVYDGHNPAFFTHDFDTMEQCRQVHVDGPFDKLCCQIKIEKPNGDFVTREFFMRDGIWDHAKVTERSVENGNGDGSGLWHQNGKPGGVDESGTSALNPEQTGKDPHVNGSHPANADGSKGENHSGATGLYKSFHLLILLYFSLVVLF